MLDFILDCQFSFNFVHHQQFKQIFLMTTNYNTILISNHIQLTEQLFLISNMQFLKFLVNFSVNAQIFLMTDCWISSNHHVFVEITIHDIFKSWKLSKTLLDFKFFNESYNDIILAQIIFNIFQKFNFLNQFMCIIINNTSNNIVMTVILYAKLVKTEIISDYNDSELKKN